MNVKRDPYDLTRDEFVETRMMSKGTSVYMGGCQNYGPLWGALNIWCRIIIGTQKGTPILTATHIYIYIYIYQGSV